MYQSVSHGSCSTDSTITRSAVVNSVSCNRQLPHASGGGDGIGDAAAVQAQVLQRPASPGLLLA